MKLISLNVEGLRHTERAMPFLEGENADVICLQEATENYVEKLQSLGYQTHFLPRCKRTQEQVDFLDGIIIGSKHEVRFETVYYYGPTTEVPFEVFDPVTERNTCLQGVIVAHITYNDQVYAIATTHFTWAPNGNISTDAQHMDMDAFLFHMEKYKPHVMCGDFNIPRGHNDLYDKLLIAYKDAVPELYATSLDAEFHRLRLDQDRKVLLERYMVDYILTQEPYRAEDVRLQFGVSDHAAVIATILR